MTYTSAAHYPCKPYRGLPTEYISIVAIEPPRHKGTGFPDFNIKKLRTVARDIVKGRRLPIEVRILIPGDSYKYRIRHPDCRATNRFYLPKELGLAEIPAAVFDSNA